MHGGCLRACKQQKAIARNKCKDGEFKANLAQFHVLVDLKEGTLCTGAFVIWMFLLQRSI